MLDGKQTQKPINPSKHWCKNFKANGNGRTPNACERCGRILSWHEGSKDGVKS